jgi:DNA polymerase-3 subunit delta
VWGDEPLLAQEAADLIRAAARAAGHTERQVHHVTGAHFNWSGLLGAAQAMSLFADRQLIEIRIPSGKPGKDGSDALQRYCEALSDDVSRSCTCPAGPPAAGSALVRALDGAGVCVRIDRSSARRCRPGSRSAWRRRASACSRARPASRRSPSSPTASRATCWPPPGDPEARAAVPGRRARLRADRAGGAERRALRRLQARRGRAGRAGRAALRMLDGLQAEGEAAVLVHWTLAEDIRGMKRVKDALANGKPLPWRCAKRACGA